LVYGNHDLGLIWSALRQLMTNILSGGRSDLLLWFLADISVDLRHKSRSSDWAVSSQCLAAEPAWWHQWLAITHGLLGAII